ncbi:MAG: hypothetical protein CMJ54_00080 [Planctomycetaceae bacterium]|nr:hypothetical protein [Planctomycetaceae bacterium]
MGLSLHGVLRSIGENRCVLFPEESGDECTSLAGDAMTVIVNEGDQVAVVLGWSDPAIWH